MDATHIAMEVPRQWRPLPSYKFDNFIQSMHVAVGLFVRDKDKERLKEKKDTKTETPAKTLSAKLQI